MVFKWYIKLFFVVVNTCSILKLMHKLIKDDKGSLFTNGT